MNLLELLNIKTETVTATKVVLKMEIKPEHQQPYGLMHGGISCVLAETAASLGANQNLDSTQQVAVGLDIQTTHLRPMKLGELQAIATPIKVGRQVQTWQVKLFHQAHQISAATVNLFNQPVKLN